MKRIQQVSLSLFLLLCLLLSACGAAPGGTQTSFSLENVPAFSGEPYVALSDNQPDFTQEELDQAAQGFEEYSPLDSLGRCGTAYASVGLDTMPTEDRESISSIKPSGWQTAKYDTDLVDGGYLYNRCHLIGFQLTGENANQENLITGTRYLNVEGMLPFENLVADYVKETGNHVLYRVTPVFSGTELVARGVELEALSVEDGGEGVCFHVYCYNNQLILSSDCPSNACSFTGAACVTNEGQIVTDAYTDYYVTCQGGVLSYPFPVGPGVQCYNGRGVPDSGLEPPTGDGTCSFDGIRCISPTGIFTEDVCVEQYRRCVDGVLSPVMKVDQGFICNTGEIRSCVNCLCLAPIHRCSFVGIQCVTEFGFIAAEGEATA